MALLFKKVQKKNPQDPSAPYKWYVSLRSIGRRKESEIAIMAADGTTLDPKEAQLAYSRFGKVTIQSLLDGYTVEIENLGSFRLTVNSEGTVNKEDLTANHVKSINLRFVPYESTKDALKKATFKDFETM